MLQCPIFTSRQIHDNTRKMPQPTKSETILLLSQLEDISEMISQNTDLASGTLEAFKIKHQPFTQKPVAAKADLLTLIIASVRNNFGKAGIDDKKLLNYLKSTHRFDEAAQLLLAKARHFFQNGNIAEGEKVVDEVRVQLLDKVSPRTEIVYLTRLTFLCGRKHQYDEQLKINLLALDKLNAMSDKTAWHYNISTVFYTNIANNYLTNSDFDKAWIYLQQSLEIAGREKVSTYNKFNVYSHFAFYYESKGDHRLSAEWQEKVIDLLNGDDMHRHYLVQAYFLAIIQYSLLYRLTVLSQKEKRIVTDKQDKFLEEVSRLVPPEPASGNYLMLLYVRAMLAHQKGNQAKAAALLNRCFPAYIKMKHHAYILNCYRLAHEIYYAWGKDTGDAKKLLKAYELKQKESEIIEADSKQSHLQKMEAARVKYDLQQAELSGKLLKQQVEAMNKEVQLTALNLQEKIVLLDDLKAFVSSLKRKDYEGRQFARAVEQKIGTIKITEQDKALLQQKIDDGNAGLFNTLAEMYPTLTPHEVRTCGLIKTGMTNKELSKLYGIGERGYEQLRHRIKIKMKLKRGDNLVKHLMELSAR
ncbi:MAG: transcriptional regulator [Bacteroidota bacterium]|nr:transcriptional regulator [Bacteroidota bacterium]